MLVKMGYIAFQKQADIITKESGTSLVMKKQRYMAAGEMERTSDIS